jgi:peptidoglycan/LPS O-acetylase OafA/YrhL
MLRPLTWGVPAAAIVLGTVALERYWGHRLPKWLLLLGNASYSIYLIQEFVFPFLHAGVKRLGGARIHTRPLETGIVMMIVSMIVTAAVGVAVYLWVERRMTEFFKSKFGAERLSPVIR